MRLIGGKKKELTCIHAAPADSRYLILHSTHVEIPEKKLQGRAEVTFRGHRVARESWTGVQHLQQSTVVIGELQSFIRVIMARIKGHKVMAFFSYSSLCRKHPKIQAL